ncbi:unnamed protein product [Rotaria sp. Silwood2]|nr:unnamed protein product [Rotaria sp. Silwood2]
MTHCWTIMMTWFVVEYLAYYVALMNLWYKIDLLTVFLFTWQLCSLGIKWIPFQLLPPIVILEQSSLCMITALTAWITDIIFVRYLPRELSLFLLWLVSIQDIYICLHHRGHLYSPWLMFRRLVKRKKPLNGAYYVLGMDKWEKSALLGLGDFYVYNILMLLVIPQSASMSLKVCVTLGSIISVQVGQLLTNYLQCLFKVRLAPGVPFPVMMVSLYTLLLDIIMTNSSECVKL